MLLNFDSDIEPAFDELRLTVFCHVESVETLAEGGFQIIVQVSTHNTLNDRMIN